MNKMLESIFWILAIPFIVMIVLGILLAVVGYAFATMEAVVLGVGDIFGDDE